MKTTTLLYLPLILLLFQSKILEAQLFRPYKCGPVLKKDQLQMFDTLNQVLGINPGDAFAEVGASSGYYNGAMAVYLEDVDIYLQDIDEACLNETNLKKLLKYYSKYSDSPIGEKNKFRIAIGTETKTNLPENTMNVIYSNGTYHALSYPDSILTDIYKSMKPSATLSIRDEFINDGKERFCSDEKCGNKLVMLEVFKRTMKRNGFTLIGENTQFGYPIYTFKKSMK